MNAATNFFEPPALITDLSGRLSVTAATVSPTRQPPDSITFSECARMLRPFFSLTQPEPSHFCFMPSLPSVINLTSLRLLQVPESYYILSFCRFNLTYFICSNRRSLMSVICQPREPQRRRRCPQTGRLSARQRFLTEQLPISSGVKNFFFKYRKSERSQRIEKSTYSFTLCG